MTETTNIDAKRAGKSGRAPTGAKAWLERRMAALQNPGIIVNDCIEKCPENKIMASLIGGFIVLDVVFFKEIAPVEVTGLVIILIFVFMTRNIDKEFSSAVDCLASMKSIKLELTDHPGGEVISVIDNENEKFKDEILNCKNRIMFRSSAWFLVSMVIFIGMAVCYLIFMFKYNPYPADKIYLFLVHAYFSVVITLVAMAIGARLGRMACLGFRLVYAIGCDENTYQIRFKPMPGHADGKCGLKAINSFFVYQVECSSILFIYILSWCVVFIFEKYPINAAVNVFGILPLNLIPPKDLANTTVFFVVILAVVFVLQVVGILLPVMGIRKAVLKERDKSRADVQPKNQRILYLRNNLLEEMAVSGRRWEDIRFEIEVAEKLVKDVERMGYWPLSRDSMRPLGLFLMELVPLILLVVEKVKSFCPK